LNSRKHSSEDELPRVKHHTEEIKMSRLETTFESPKKNKRDDEYYEDNDNYYRDSVTMVEVESKINEILIMHRQSIIENIDKYQEEASLKFDENVMATNTLIETTKIMLQNMIEATNSETNSQTKTELENLQNLIQDNSVQIEGIHDKLSDEAKRRRRDKTDLNILIDGVSGRLNAEESKNQNVGKSLQNMGEITATILELSHIGNILD
jgi:hypothetical protein